MKAIQVKYLPATNTKPSRLKASAEGVKSVIMGYSECEDLSKDGMQESVFLVPANKLQAQMGWNGELVGGGLPDGSWAFCFKKGE